MAILWDMLYTISKLYRCATVQNYKNVSNKIFSSEGIPWNDAPCCYHAVFLQENGSQNYHIVSRKS